MSRPTLARREPLTVGAAAPLFCAVVAGIAVAGSAVAALTGGEVADPVQEALALAAIAAAGGVLTVGAGGFLSPFRGLAHALVLGLLLGAAVLDGLAHRGAGGVTLLIACPLLLLALAVLRPPAEVLGGGLLLAGAATAAVLPTSGTPSRLIATAATTAAAALTASAFGRVALRRLGDGGPAQPTAGPTPAMRLSLQQEAVARLEAEAIPLLVRVAAAGVLEPADRVLAGDIADRLRAALVADLARGWLAELGLAVEDRGGYGERMTAQQRTALRTVLAALPIEHPDRPGRALVHGQDLDAQVRLEVPLRVRPDRRRLAAVVPLLRSAFAHADVRVEGGRAVVVATWSVQP